MFCIESVDSLFVTQRSESLADDDGTSEMFQAHSAT
jgi:hypothetical protein